MTTYHNSISLRDDYLILYNHIQFYNIFNSTINNPIVYNIKCSVYWHMYSDICRKYSTFTVSNTYKAVLLDKRLLFAYCCNYVNMQCVQYGHCHKNITPNLQFSLESVL